MFGPQSGHNQFEFFRIRFHAGLMARHIRSYNEERSDQDN